jgi:hypothetical protein
MLYHLRAQSNSKFIRIKDNSFITSNKNGLYWKERKESEKKNIRRIEANNIKEEKKESIDEEEYNEKKKDEVKSIFLSKFSEEDRTIIEY